MSEQKPSPAPRLGVRLICWFAIYYFAVLIWAFCFTLDPFVSPFLFGLAMPVGLFGLVDAIGFSKPSPLPDFLSSIEPIGYVVYAFHLFYTCRVRSLRSYLILLVILVVMIALNIPGCAYQTEYDRQPTKFVTVPASHP